MHDEEARLRVPSDTGGHTAAQEPPDAPVPPVAHDDQPGIDVLGDVEDRARSVAFDEVAFVGDTPMFEGC